jgi:hypothetical protein
VAAVAAWDGFFHSRLEEILDASDRPLLARIDLTLKKLMLIFAINERTERITTDLVRRVSSLTDYLESCYDAVAGLVRKSATAGCEDAILEMVDRATWSGRVAPSRSEIVTYLKRRGFKVEDTNRTIDALVNAEMLALVPPDATRPGPKAERYCRAAIAA